MNVSMGHGIPPTQLAQLRFSSASPTTFLIISALFRPRRRYNVDSTGPYHSFPGSGTMLASRLVLSLAVLGLAAAAPAGVFAQDPKSASETTKPAQNQAPKEEGHGAPPGRPGGPRGVRSVPKPGPTE